MTSILFTNEGIFGRLYFQSLPRQKNERICMYTTTSQPHFPSHCQVLNSLQYAEMGGLFYHMNDYLGRRGEGFPIERTSSSCFYSSTGVLNICETKNYHCQGCRLVPRPHPRGEGLVTSSWFLWLLSGEKFLSTNHIAENTICGCNTRKSWLL